MSNQPLLSVDNLKKHYPITSGLLDREVGRVRAVDGISFSINPGEIFGLVGESGCGKSTAATTILRIEDPTEGRIFFDGEDITEFTPKQLKWFRRRAQMVFQDPTSSFDPRMSIGDSITEPLRVNGIANRKKRNSIAERLLERVGLSAEDLHRYPHEFSGGQKQRIALARAIVVNPELIVADEPVSALDVSVQAGVLSLLLELQSEFDLAILLISHDMAVVKEVCDRVAVMYLGEIVEIAETETLFTDPQHPYTQALLSSIPNPDPRDRGWGVELSGDVPDPANPPPGCRFNTRCPAIIPPDSLDITQEEWRKLFDFVTLLRNGNLNAQLIPEADSDVLSEPGQPVPSRDHIDRIRSQFDLPSEFSDPKATRVLDQLLIHLATGDIDKARHVVTTELGTPCDKFRPKLRANGNKQPVACHLHNQPH